MTEMLRLSVEVHSKIIRQAVSDVTDEEIDKIIYDYPTISPFYYPDWWDEKRSVTLDESNNIDLDYERLAMRVISSSDPIRLVVIESLALFNNDDDEDLIDLRIDNCINDHRRLVLKMRNPSYFSDSDEDYSNITQMRLSSVFFCIVHYDGMPLNIGTFPRVDDKNVVFDGLKPAISLAKMLELNTTGTASLKKYITKNCEWLSEVKEYDITDAKGSLQINAFTVFGPASGTSDDVKK
jgi:hypothetical protein